MFAELESETFRSLPFGLHTLCPDRLQEPTNRPNGFKYHHLLWVTQGCGVYRIGNERFTLSEGEGVFMRAGVPHNYYGENFHTAWCTFSMSEALLDALGIEQYFKFKVPSDFERETEELYRYACGSSTLLGRSSAGYSYVIGLFSSILSADEGLASKVRRYLEQKYSEPLTLTCIADAFGIDRFKLCHIYKKEFGTTVMEELNSIRIQKAKQMLRYSTATAEKIGKACGFESPAYFSKCFRETVGCTPIKYRKNYR